MIDTSTLDAYDSNARDYAREWHEQPPPIDLHALVRRYFHKGPTVDVGCGAGREAAWLCANGYPTVGIDPSEGLLEEARRRHPEVQFMRGSLPDLVGVARGSYANVLCETVIMHLDSDSIGPSVRRLLELLAPDGTVYLSWRVTEGSDRRDEKGRLYAAFDPSLVSAALAGARVLLDEQATSISSGRTVRRMVARKSRQTLTA